MPKLPSIPIDEYASRRKSLRRKLNKSCGLLFAGEHADSDSAFRPHPHFEYLTGVTDEPGAVVVLDPNHPVEDRRDVLLLPPRDPEEEKWDGFRPEINQALRERTGFRTIYRTNRLPQILTVVAQRSKSLACLHPLAAYNQPVSPDLDIFQKVAERIPGVEIVDRSELLLQMRAVKSRAEVQMLQRAIDITAIGFDTVLRAIRPGMNEFDVQETLEHAYRSNGARQVSFSTIAGSGINSTVLHYEANDQVLQKDDLILIDSGAVFGGYRADITRTVPISGRFTDRQREIYEIVLKAEEAAIRACKPGARLTDLDKVARAVIQKAGYGDAFIHSVGHHLGLETHDASPDEPLKAGAVVTIEPGIYLPEEGIGVRIEDDILITSKGPRNLSKAIPKTVKEIESLMAKARS